MVTSNQPELPETPVKRFPASLMNMFHARGMDNGEPGMGIFRCLECGSVVMEGLVKEHRGESRSSGACPSLPTDWFHRLVRRLCGLTFGARSDEKGVVEHVWEQEGSKGKYETDRERE
jgi:hypothetical protein